MTEEFSDNSPVLPRYGLVGTIIAYFINGWKCVNSCVSSGQPNCLKAGVLKGASMKKTLVLVLASLLVLSVSVLAKDKADKVNLGIYSTPDDFSTKFWKEMFKGGGPGQPGNTLQAIGTGFTFEQAILQQTVCTPPETDGVNIWLPCTTTYVGGKLILNPSGPWLDSGTLKASDVTATNLSKTYLRPDGLPNGILEFTITFSGQFDRSPYKFDVTASWGPGIPETKFDENGLPVFQRGSDYDATIIIK